MKELTIQDLPNYPHVFLTGELGITRVEDRWERDGQQLLGPISKLILTEQPHEVTWIEAAVTVTGWSTPRVFAFQLQLSQMSFRMKDTHGESAKGHLDATLYRLLYKMAKVRYDFHLPG